jgi:hypothetical protein
MRRAAVASFKHVLASSPFMIEIIESVVELGIQYGELLEVIKNATIANPDDQTMLRGGEFTYNQCTQHQYQSHAKRR